MNNIRSVENLTEVELQHNIFGGISKGSWHEKYKGSAWVYLGGLPFELTEGDVICVMSQWGEIEDIHLVREKDTGKSKGFAFVKYEDHRSTILAVDNVNGAKLLNRVLRCDHVDQYRLPKDVQERESAQWEERGGGSIDIGPGHAYKGKELANDFDINSGVNLWSNKSSTNPVKNPKDDDKKMEEAPPVKREEMAARSTRRSRSRSSSPYQYSSNILKDDKEVVENESRHFKDDESSHDSRRGRARKRSEYEDRKRTRDRDDSRSVRSTSSRRSHSRSSDRKRAKKSKKDKKHKKHKRSRTRRDSRSRSRSISDRSENASRFDKYDKERYEHRKRRRYDSSRDRNDVRRSAQDKRSDSDNESIDSRTLRRQREESIRLEKQKEVEKAMLAAAIAASEVLGPSNSSSSLKSGTTGGSGATGKTGGGGLILSGGGPVASWRGRRDPEIRTRLAAAEKKLQLNSSAVSSSYGSKNDKDEVSGIGGARRIR